MPTTHEASEPDEAVRVHAEGGVLTIGINRPDQRNAVNAAVADGIAAALDRLDRSAELRVGVVYGVGNVFCAGMDLKAFAAGDVMHHPVRGFAGIVRDPPAKPIIAAVEGWALGGLAARGGAVFRLPRKFPAALAMELILTGEPLNASRAAEFGLVNRVAQAGEALAVALAANAPMSVRASKRVVVESAEWPLDECFERQAAYLEPVFDSLDAQEGVAAFRERREPVWRDR
jgi:enoyl-CoA hydratase